MMATLGPVDRKLEETLAGHRFEMFGRRICIAEEGPGHEGEMAFGVVPGSGYVLWDDGLKVPGTDPVRP